jgi:hypothetical protein
MDYRAHHAAQQDTRYSGAEAMSMRDAPKSAPQRFARLSRLFHRHKKRFTDADTCEDQ